MFQKLYLFCSCVVYTGTNALVQLLSKINFGYHFLLHLKSHEYRVNIHISSLVQYGTHTSNAI